MGTSTFVLYDTRFTTIINNFNTDVVFYTVKHYGRTFFVILIVFHPGPHICHPIKPNSGPKTSKRRKFQKDQPQIQCSFLHKTNPCNCAVRSFGAFSLVCSIKLRAFVPLWKRNIYIMYVPLTVTAKKEQRIWILIWKNQNKKTSTTPLPTKAVPYGVKPINGGGAKMCTVTN